jgi:mycofactocin system glycosyltransferase
LIPKPAGAAPGRLSAPTDSTLPAGFRVALDPRVRFWSRGSVLVGGAPWRVARIDDRARGFVALLRAARATDIPAESTLQRSVARLLIDRGFSHPRPDPIQHANITVVVPAHGRIEALSTCLQSLKGQDVLVVDDCSPDPRAIAEVAAAAGARVVWHPTNRGPAAARNTGLAATSGDLVAFVDSDCAVPPDWLKQLAGHFADPLVALVAPRVAPDIADDRLLSRHEAARSALDMGEYPEQVRPGARLSFVPSAAIVVRRSALAGSGFDESLRLGEDVDLVWRLVAAGWQVRYDPTVAVTHESRTDFANWVTRRFEYGGSAADLAARHPGQLAPTRLSSWNLAVLALLVARRPRAAGVVAVTASVLLARRLRMAAGSSLLAPVTVATGIVADAASVGHALRREWWPLGAVCLATTSRARTSRFCAAAMIAPICWELLRRKPAVDPIRYLALRLIEDAAYGSGVIASAFRARRFDPLKPEIRLPFLRFWRSQ